MSFIDATRAWARRLKRDALTLWFARTDPAPPWAAKMRAAQVVAYALSPLDLIPDFIPVLGYVDDVQLLPAVIWLALRLLPPAVVQASRARAEQWMAEAGARPRSLVGGIVIVLVWLALGTALGVWLMRR